MSENKLITVAVVIIFGVALYLKTNKTLFNTSESSVDTQGVVDSVNNGTYAWLNLKCFELAPTEGALKAFSPDYPMTFKVDDETGAFIYTYNDCTIVLQYFIVNNSKGTFDMSSTGPTRCSNQAACIDRAKALGRVCNTLTRAGSFNVKYKKIGMGYKMTGEEDGNESEICQGVAGKTHVIEFDAIRK